MHVAVARLKVKSEYFAEFIKRLEEHVSASRAERRCTKFEVNAAVDDRTDLLYYEQYPDAEAFERHVFSPRVERHLAETANMIDGEIWFKRWNSISGGW